jgi:hypothetical protein
MAYFEKISALPPIPSELPRAQHTPRRKPHEERPDPRSARRPTQDDRDRGHEGGFRIDEYA